MRTAVIIAASVIGGLILLYLIIRTVARAARRRLARKISQRFRPDEIILSTVNANYFGLESLRGKQWRGNCALVLTRHILWSCLAAPQRELPLPLSRIRKVSLVRSHCGRSILLDLLRVDFHAAGTHDAVAWYVRDAQKWMAAITAAVQGQSDDRNPQKRSFP